MHIYPGGSTPPAPGNSSSTEQLAKVAAGQPVPGEIPPKQTTPQEQISQRLLAQVVGQGKDGLVQVRTLANNTSLSLLSQQPLRAGQLVLVEVHQSNGRTELSLQTGNRPLTDQLLRLLVPQGGDLKAKVSQALQVAHGIGSTPSQTQNSLGTSPTNTTRAQQNGLSFLKQSPTNSNLAVSNTNTKSTVAGSEGIWQKLQNLIQPKPAHPSTAQTTNQTHLPLPNPQLQSLWQQLMPTAQLREPAQVAPLLQPGHTPALLKLVMPLLQSNLVRVPVNAEQQQQRDSQTTALTQLAARILLGALRAPNVGNEVEVSRAEWITRFEQSLDSLQVELNVVREQVKEKESGDNTADPEQAGKIRQWRVRLAFEFEELGLITAFVLLSEQHKMEVQFWSERDSTRHKLEQFRTDFNHKLEGAVAAFGVEKLDVGVYEGNPPPSRQNLSTHLIDETA